MRTLLTLILDGDFDSGFQATLETRQGDIHSPTQSRTQGRLSGNENILNRYRDWQRLYLSLEMLFRALSANPEQVTSSSQGKEALTAFHKTADVFQETLNDWLNNCVDFRAIRDKLLQSQKNFNSFYRQITLGCVDFPGNVGMYWFKQKRNLLSVLSNTILQIIFISFLPQKERWKFWQF